MNSSFFAQRMNRVQSVQNKRSQVLLPGEFMLRNTGREPKDFSNSVTRSIARDIEREKVKFQKIVKVRDNIEKQTEEEL